MMKLNRILALLLALTMTTLFGLTHADSDDIDSSSYRRAALLERELSHPFPNDAGGTSGSSTATALGQINYALAAFLVNANNNEIARANDDLDRAAQFFDKDSEFQKELAQDPSASSAYNDVFHFDFAQLIYRVIRDFGATGMIRSNLLKPAIEEHLRSIFTEWASAQCPSPHQTSNVWEIWGSENHDAQLRSACWAAADLSWDQASPTRNSAASMGHTAQNALAWTKSLKSYLQSRLRNPLFVEYFSPTYSKYTLLSLYLLADYSRDRELKRLAAQTIDLWWAIWAEEQIDGIHGGSEARAYPQTNGQEGPMQSIGWLYFNLGRRPLGYSPGEAAMVASSYRPPATIARVAEGVPDRGSYQVISRAPGLVKGANHGETTFIDALSADIVRVTYIDPSFAMGLAMMPWSSGNQWAAFSTQNQRSCVVMAGGDPSHEVCTLPSLSNSRTGYNAYWGVQSKATQIIQMVSPPLSKGVLLLRIWFGPKLKLVEKNGWVFVDDKAFVAVRPALGGYRWDNPEKRLLTPILPSAPLIIQAAPRSRYPSLALFEQAIFNTPLQVDQDVVRFDGLLNGGTIKFYLRSHRDPDVNGTPISFSPAYTIQSPFVNMGAFGKTIVIGSGAQEEIINQNQ